MGLREGENKETQMNEREREREREKATTAIIIDGGVGLVAASYSHGDLAIDKGLVEERNFLNFWI